MRAIVCDRCGKVVLLGEDERGYIREPLGHYVLQNDELTTKLDLCEECATDLIKAVREVKCGHDE